MTVRFDLRYKTSGGLSLVKTLFNRQTSPTEPVPVVGDLVFLPKGWYKVVSRVFAYEEKLIVVELEMF